MKVRYKMVLICIASLSLMACNIKFEFGIVSNHSVINSSSVIEPSVIEPSIESLPVSNESISIETEVSTSISQTLIEEELNHTHDSDPYYWVVDNATRQEFYQNYYEACCYEDAQYRTAHGLLSGDISDQSHLPNEIDCPKDENGRYYRLNDANYTYRENGEYESYTINRLDKTKGRTIYYNGAYASLNDVAAYLLAFGETPPNTIKGKESYDKEEAVNNWWKYGRVNDGYFSNDSSSYRYEPELPYASYKETDFGASTSYTVGNYQESTYNDGNRISGRMACRFVYVNGAAIDDIRYRRVFYTYNHYNDFQEYLNYEDGFGERFGNETAGNTADRYNPINPPSNYVSSVPIDFELLVF